MAHFSSPHLPVPETVSRREFARLLSLGGAAALVAHPSVGRALERTVTRAVPLVPPVNAGDEERWAAVRDQFLMPSDLHLFNAANLCPAPAPVLHALSDHTRRMDASPSPAVRAEMQKVKEATRRRLAEFLRVTPEEIVITRNTSEGNNFVSSGLDLSSGDEVIVFGDNHPSNHAAWREKAKRFGYTVTVLEQPTPHPGADHYLDVARKAIGARTRVIAFSHVSNTVGDLLPARELCGLARERGVLSLVDGAQSFGVLDVDLRRMDPDFFTGSAHKWPCGPFESGILFVNARAQARLWPTIISLYAGEVGISKRFEGLGQRDEPAILAFGEALAFHTRVGPAAIEARTRALAQRLIERLRGIDGVTIWTHADPARSASVVSFQPASLDPARLAASLFEKDGIVCAARSGENRGGLRCSPHFYNSTAEIDALAAAVEREVKGRG